MINPKKAPTGDLETLEENEQETPKEAPSKEEEDTYLDLPGDEVAGDGFPDSYYW